MNRQHIWQAKSDLGVIAGGGEAAVEAGAQVLREGGNAIDAGITTVLALQVTDHGECSIGGEVPILVYDAASGQVKAISGMGGAPLNPEAIAWYMQHGIPGAGDMKIAPVPSVVATCCLALQQFGTITFGRAVAPTLALLDAGNASWHAPLARTLRRMVAAEAQASGSRAEKIQAACDLFYGRSADQTIADQLEAFYIERGGFLRKADLQAHRARVEEPVSVDYRGYRIHKCDTWTQGAVLCQALRLLEGFDLPAMGVASADEIHVAMEAMKLAFADRDAYYGDPLFVDVPLAQLFSEEYTRLRRELIDLGQAASQAMPGDPYNMRPLGPPATPQPVVGGTTTCVSADRWGNLLAATPSANVLKGAHEGGEAGVTFGNRLRSLNTTPGHPNCIAPGKRPRITLTPTLVTRDGKGIMAISVAGGDMQDQAALQLLLDVIDFGMSVDRAVTRPRYATYHHQDSFDPNPDRRAVFLGGATLHLNQAIDAATAEALAARGHKVTRTENVLGVPVMAQRDPVSGALAAAGDPKAGRHARGI